MTASSWTTAPHPWPSGASRPRALVWTATSPGAGTSGSPRRPGRETPADPAHQARAVQREPGVELHERRPGVHQPDGVAGSRDPADADDRQAPAGVVVHEPPALRRAGGPR